MNATASRRSRRRRPKMSLTTPDLVLLSLLAEAPMHGYQIDALLEARNIRDWAAVSRPQIYYSLDKLTAGGLVAAVEDPGTTAGPERRVFKTTARGRRELGDALDEERWAVTRERPAFLTWLALSWKALPGSFQRQLNRRRSYLESELAREEATLKDVLDEVGHPYHEAVWMLKLTIAGIGTELTWLGQLRREASRRAPARRKGRLQ